MLTLSRKPQILRLHELQQTQRERYINQFSHVGQEWLPNNYWQIFPLIADIYYTYITICKCKRRLGQQYTYVTMYNPKHYKQQGVLLNKNTRILMFVMEIIQRHLIKIMGVKLLGKIEKKIQNQPKFIIFKNFISLGVQGILQQGKMFMLMLFLLGWNQYFNVVDTLLKNQYVYTYLNKNNVRVDYTVQAYMLLVVFIVSSWKILRENKKQKKASPEIQNRSEQQKEDKENELCRICYDTIKYKSVTCCGHVFCWDCILKYLGTHPECPVCRAECKPKEVIQLQNY